MKQNYEEFTTAFYVQCELALEHERMRRLKREKKTAENL